MPGLHQDPSSFGASPRSPRHLRQQLESALGRAKVGEVEPGVGIHHPDQGDVGEIEPLGNHLGSDQ